MTLKIKFSRKTPSIEAESFDMGDISIELKDEKISSQGNSNHLMMIYIAIADLIFGVLRLNDWGGVYKFIGADSSFSIDFKSKGDTWEISQKKGKKISCKKSEFVDALYAGVHDFIAAGNNLKIPDSVSSDLNLAIGELVKAKSP